MRNPDHMLAIGVFSLLLAGGIGLMAGGNSVLDFLMGLMLGISVTMNLAYLVITRNTRSSA